MKNRRVHLVVEGMVQRVCFRDSTRRKAMEYEIKGWVKNRPDGTVEIVAEGPEEDIRSFVEWCRKGPPYAVVSKITEYPQEYMNEFDSFDIVF
ncbi:MAG: acylphosphatase [Deltaproteobacteria bacterium]|nr:acylphosphatase [Deltaproteobacteria bacterium]